MFEAEKYLTENDMFARFIVQYCKTKKNKKKHRKLFNMSTQVVCISSGRMRSKNYNQHLENNSCELFTFKARE